MVLGPEQQQTVKKRQEPQLLDQHQWPWLTLRFSTLRSRLLANLERLEK